MVTRKTAGAAWCFLMMVAFSYGAEGGPQCLSGIGRFVFASHRHPVKATDLTFCSGYSPRTCCDSGTTDAVVKDLVMSNDDVSDLCKRGWRVLACAACHPGVGTGQMGVCSRFCASVYEACKEDSFVFDRVHGALHPCPESSMICSPLHTFVPDHNDFCEKIGYTVDENEATGCFNGKEPPPIHRPGGSQSRARGWFEDGILRHIFVDLHPLAPALAVSALLYAIYKGRKLRTKVDSKVAAAESDLARVRQAQQERYMSGGGLSHRTTQ